MNIRTKEIQGAAQKARTAAEQIRKISIQETVSDSDTKAVLDHFDQLYDNVMILAEKLTQEGQVSEFGKFFTAVGDSLVRAQKEMDKKSAHYIEETRNQPHVLPSTFRIPKISANIKFALQSVKGSKVNLLFYSKQKESQERHEQSLQFDIISAPPPPEIMEKIITGRLRAGKLPAVSFVTGPDERKAIFDAIEESAKNPERSLLKSRSDRVLVCESRDAGPEDDVHAHYYLILANPKQEEQSDEEASKNLGVWYLTIGPDVEPKFETVYSYYRKPSKSEIAGAHQIYKALLDACDDQEAYLGGPD